MTLDKAFKQSIPLFRCFKVRMRFILLFCFIYTCTIYSQVPRAIGEWTDHLPYQHARWVTQSDTKIIFSTDFSVFTIDKEDLSRQTISKENGLSDIGISQLEFDRFNEQLIIAYDNSNVDILTPDAIINLPNILSNQNISGDRTIYDIHIMNEESILLALGFGVVEIRSQTVDFGFTTRAPRMNAISSRDNIIFAGSDDGLFIFDRSSTGFEGDFNSWPSLGVENGLPPVYEVTDLVRFGNRIYAIIDGELWFEDGDLMFNKLLSPDPGFQLIYISADGPNLLVGQRNSNNQSNTTLINGSGEMTNIDDGCINNTLYGLEDEQGRIWYADLWDLIRFNESSSGGCQQFSFDSPFAEETSDIEIKGNTIYVASGGVTDNFTFSFSRNGTYIFEENDWTNVNQNEFSIFRTQDILNFFRVQPHPDLDVVYMGTYWAGLVEFNEETQEIRVFDAENSSLRGAVGDEARERVSGMAFDQENNLWLANFGAPEPISVLTPEGNWHSFNVGNNNNLSNVVIDNFDNKWFPVFGNNGGVVVFNHGDRIEDPTDDEYKFISPSNSELTTNAINDIEIDLEGSVWVATEEGPVIFDCGSDPFDDECTGRRIRVLQDSIAAFLLADVDINTIEVDGANRKWFGTTNGIFVQNATGDEQELRFTSEDSPLFDNNIIELSYNRISGDMWIGSDKGLQVFRTKTTGARRVHSSDVISFPNPVPPDYEGPIAIKGLANDVNVKITDINGKLVYETNSFGGQAIWDGRDFQGRKVATGVYLVFSATTDIFFDPDSFVSKIMVVR